MVTTAKCSEEQIHFNSYFGFGYQSTKCGFPLQHKMMKCSTCNVFKYLLLTAKPVLSSRNPGDPNQLLQSACLRGWVQLGWSNFRRLPACQYFNGDVYHNSDDAQIKTVHWTLRLL